VVDTLLSHHPLLRVRRVLLSGGSQRSFL
jgi:hypothetical protein